MRVCIEVYDWSIPDCMYYLKPFPFPINLWKNNRGILSFEVINNIFIVCLQEIEREQMTSAANLGSEHVSSSAASENTANVRYVTEGKRSSAGVWGNKSKKHSRTEVVRERE